jgi:hypothetical protein
VAEKGSPSKGCSDAEHGQTCTKNHTGAVAVRAALESAVQLGRGHEGNRQPYLWIRYRGIALSTMSLS